MAPSPVLDAVTGILASGGKVYMARRSESLASFAGYWAFPGGKVEAGDADGDDAHAAAWGIEPRLFCALARELGEELGLDLRREHGDGSLLTCGLVGSAITPTFAPVRFNTRFYLLQFRRQPRIDLDLREHSRGEWRTASEWLGQYESGDLLLAPPTHLALVALAQNPAHPEMAFGDFEASSTIGLVQTIVGVRQFAVRSHTVPPARHTNCFLLGDKGSHRILVDPSPDSLEELGRLEATVGPLGFDEIFLTHHHPDHHEHADTLARRFKVPLGMSLDTHARIAHRTPAFFNGVAVVNHRDGDVVTHWLGQPVRVLEVPGHDEGQLALMPDSRAWCLVGDLIQGIGTVVISAPEGDMAKYFSSLEKIITLQPRAIYPSHGLALGGTYYLEKTLAHRRMREAQIKELSALGHSVEDILPIVYENLMPALVPLARRNIESHLVKLRKEGVLA